MGDYTGNEEGLSSTQNALDEAQHKVDEAKQKAQAGLARVMAQAEGMQAQAKDQLERADTAIQGFARANPLAALAGAAVAGFVIGRLASKL